MAESQRDNTLLKSMALFLVISSIPLAEWYWMKMHKKWIVNLSNNYSNNITPSRDVLGILICTNSPSMQLFLVLFCDLTWVDFMLYLNLEPSIASKKINSISEPTSQAVILLPFVWLVIKTVQIEFSSLLWDQVGNEVGCSLLTRLD